MRDGLLAAGVTQGAPVAVMLGNGPETIATLFGVWAAGGVYVPVNPRLTDPEVGRLTQAVPPAAVVTTESERARFPEPCLRRARPPGRLRRAGRTGRAAQALRRLTSRWCRRPRGPPGPPTPVPLRHSQVLALLDGVLGTVRTRGDSARDAPAMPNLVPVSLSLWAGIYNVLFAFRVGAPVVLMERFEPNELARLVAEHRIRSVVLPPAAMAMCCDDPGLASLAPLRYVRSITAPLSPYLARRFHDRFGVAVLNCYGQTELGGEVVGWSAADWREFGSTKLGAVGRPHAGVELRIDETGELWVRTPASRTAPPAALGDRATEDGWLRTGDLGRIDDDGFLWIEGRASDMVNRGGLKVFPAEVEEVLRSVPGVRDVAVVGVPDERLGELPVAAVVGDASPEELDAACRAHLAPYKVPARFVFVDALPRNEVGKILRDRGAGALHPGLTATPWDPQSTATGACCLLELAQLLFEVGERLDVHLRDPLEPPREPPVAVSEQLHGRGHEHDADERRVDEDRRRETDPEELDHPDVAQHEASEDAHHDRRRRGDHASGRGQAVGDGEAVVTGSVVLLPNARQQEDLVVHREPEHDREQHHRDERLDGPGPLDAQQPAEPAPLEDGDDHTVCGADRQQVHHHGLDRAPAPNGTRRAAG